MLNVRKSLPQLDPLIAFEAAARHSSFALAAKELNVTASAISQQLKSLETQLAVTLFKRGHKSVELTTRGKEFHNSVSVALMHLVNAASELRSSHESNRLEIATDTSIASHWLMPRLRRFEAEFPDVSLRLSVTDIQQDLLAGQFDLAIVHGEGSWRGYQSEVLFEEEVFPVVAPTYLAENGGCVKLNELPECHLLDLEYERWHWMNWAIWLTEMSLPLPQSPRKMRTNSYPLLIEAAQRGSGFALGWRYLVDEKLAEGSLIRPFDTSVTTRYAYHIVQPFNSPLSGIGEKFKQWLRDEAGTLVQ